MARRSNRPLTSIVFPKSGEALFNAVELPLEIEALEEAIVRRFVKCLNNEGDNIEYLGRAPEPGDALLGRPQQSEIYLQLGEVVDRRRIQTHLRRNDYGTSLWEDKQLRSMYAGIQLWILDNGEACDFPKPSSTEGRQFRNELLTALKALGNVVDSLPENTPGELKGKKTRVDIPSQHITLDVQMIRIAPKFDYSPTKWIWGGSHRVQEDDAIISFKEVLGSKTRFYGKINQPFWLLLYTLDCMFDLYEQAVLADFAATNRHPFDRISVFLPTTVGGEEKQIYPRPKHIPQIEQIERKKLLARLLPEDAVPKWNDPRWHSLGDQENASDDLAGAQLDQDAP